MLEILLSIFSQLSFGSNLLYADHSMTFFHHIQSLFNSTFFKKFAQYCFPIISKYFANRSPLYFKLLIVSAVIYLKNKLSSVFEDTIISMSSQASCQYCIATISGFIKKSTALA
jgi:hypothetical protein